ncbi:MAG: fumarylacetoacetate hydrolase family protein [Armatimonadota bacterium]|nr:fumarylacetoacetate hydrolase family protein [Armatimonadota bacterium]MDR7548983.1 fumarylacetoacetate hydrolase family protein [Armatimonadota bacterium]
MMKRARVVHAGRILDVEVNGDWVLTADGRRLALHEVTFAPPCEPTKVVCVGFNYRDHAAELRWEASVEPVLFLKPPSAVIGHDAPIPYPRHTTRLEYEGELAVVIGRRGRRISRDRALEYVDGYTLFNDITARDIQQTEKQWFRAKAFDASAPLGPWIVREVDPGALDLVVRVNGEIRQAGTTRDMVFDVAALIEIISSFVTLEPGDVIATGTPRGVGPLQVGDVVEVEIPPIGVLRNRVVGDPSP